MKRINSTKNIQNKNTDQRITIIQKIIKEGEINNSISLCANCNNRLKTTESIFMAHDMKFCTNKCRQNFINYIELLTKQALHIFKYIH